MKDIKDRNNHLTDKQIWLLKMLFQELGNKTLNEALKQWEKEENEKPLLRSKVTRETSIGEVIPAEPAIMQRGDDLIPSGTKRKSRRS